MTNKNPSETICILGLGYVGLPLAVALSKHYPLIGFDVSDKRINELKENTDWSGEISKQDLAGATIEYTANPQDLERATFFIVTVPTPVTKAKIPDLAPLESAASTIGKHIRKGAVVVVESTVYPGATEEIVGPLIEQESGLTCGKDFTLGYSPERINPGDTKHTIDKIIKVISGQDDATLKRVTAVYESICHAGVFPAADIKTAEAAKVIENIQRDLNIALMNELSIIFNKLGLRTQNVLDAAGTKWNFLKFTPGLVGGHCIGVDPYYLTYKAETVGYHPEIILAGRRLNDNMPLIVTERVVSLLSSHEKRLSQSTVLILGLTFKENVKDPRNSKVSTLIEALERHGVNVIVNDPLLADEPELVLDQFGKENTPLSAITSVDAVILAVSHDAFKKVTLEKLKEWMPDTPLLFDVRNFYDRQKAEQLGFIVENL